MDKSKNNTEIWLAQEVKDLIKNDEEKGVKVAKKLGIQFSSLLINIRRNAPVLVEDETLRIIREVFGLPKSAKLTIEIQITIEKKG